jgi:radical SAM superfamily enzyme YgiQ (UPF0313 family)
VNAIRVLLISANTERINVPTLPLGLAYVAMATRRVGHEVEFLDLMLEEDAEAVIREAVGRFRPEVIGISVRNIDDQRMASPGFLLEPVKDVVAACRAISSAPIVLGGAGYSIYPASVLLYLSADMGIQGEGELAFPLLLGHMQHGTDLSETPGLYLPGHGLQKARKFARDLDTVPFPEDHLWSPSDASDEEIWLPLQTRRGCAMDCSYCSTSTIEGRIMRRRSPERVVQEIARQVEKGFQRFHFVDNTFNIPRSYARDLCRLLAAAGLPVKWRCILYPWNMDEELVSLMSRAGCREVSLGFESGFERILRSMNKRFSPVEVRRVSQMLADHDIQRMGFLLLGGPGETKESVEESLLYADSLNLEATKVTVGIRIYPNTSLARIAVQEGLISPNEDLLFPRFYLARELSDWLPETVRSWISTRRNWFT